MKVSRRSRSHNTRLIKRDSTYTVEEIAGLFGLHVNSVRLWLAQGLIAIDQKRPILVHGSDLVRFLSNKQAARRHPCGPSEFFCFRCRHARNSKNNQVIIATQANGALRMRALCSDCGTAMFKAGSIRNLAKYQEIFSVQPVQETRLVERNYPPDNCDLAKEELS